jgi:hypothetical protein
MDTSTTEANKDETKCVQMLVAWKVMDSKTFICVTLIEHVKEFTWNEDELRKLYNGNHHRLREYDDIILDTWFMDDMALRTSSKLIGSKGNFGLSISISEEEEDKYAMRPLCVDLER